MKSNTYIATLLFLGMLISGACKENIPDGYINHTIKLENDLGYITIALPSDFDTCYNWTNTTDYPCGFKKLHRFADKDFSLMRESGFYYKADPDSLYHVTIVQPKYSGCRENYITISDDYLKKRIDIILEDNQRVDIKTKRIETIDNKKFAVIGDHYAGLDTMEIENLSATTIIDSQKVSIGFTCFKPDCKDFLSEMEASLKTVQVTTSSELE